jgi:hypothetical protein
MLNSFDCGVLLGADQYPGKGRRLVRGRNPGGRRFTAPTLFRGFAVPSRLLGCEVPLDGALSGSLGSRAEAFAIGAYPIH